MISWGPFSWWWKLKHGVIDFQAGRWNFGFCWMDWKPDGWITWRFYSRKMNKAVLRFGPFTIVRS